MPTFTSYKSGMQVTDEPIYRSQFPGFVLPIAGSGVSGRVAFWNGAGSISSNANFLYDTVTGNTSIGSITTTGFLNIGPSTATKSAMRFDLGVNYTSLAAMTMWASQTSLASHFSFYDGLNHFKFGQKVGTPSTSALYLGEATPSTLNWALQHVTGGNTDLNSISNIRLMIGGVAGFSVLGGAAQLNTIYPFITDFGIRGVGDKLQLGFNASLTLSSGFSSTTRNVLIPGAITFTDTTALAPPVRTAHFYIGQPTFSSVPTAKVIPDAATMIIDGQPLAAGVLTITRSWALFIRTGNLGVGGSVKMITVGSGLFIQEGVNGTMGTATLVAGTITIATNKVTADSRIYITGKGQGVNLGFVYETKTARVVSTSFQINSLNVLDTQDVDWIIVEPNT